MRAWVSPDGASPSVQRGNDQTQEEIDGGPSLSGGAGGGGGPGGPCSLRPLVRGRASARCTEGVRRAACLARLEPHRSGGALRVLCVRQRAVRRGDRNLSGDQGADRGIRRALGR